MNIEETNGRKRWVKSIFNDNENTFAGISPNMCIKEYMDSPRDFSCMKMRMFSAISVILIKGKEDSLRPVLNLDMVYYDYTSMPVSLKLFLCSMGYVPLLAKKNGGFRYGALELSGIYT